MIHARPDYNRMQDPAGLIPEDEPVFLLRAKDAYAPVTILFWAFQTEQHGGSPEIVQIARDHANKMLEWQQTHDTEVADLPEEVLQQVRLLLQGQPTISQEGQQ